MSMQICVLTDLPLSSIAEWQKAIDAEGFPLRLSNTDPYRDIAARLRDEETSIRYSVYDFAELKETYKNTNFSRDWKYAISFTWSSDFAEEIAAWMAATAYARATDGAVFDQQVSKLFSPDESLQITQEIERVRPEKEAIFQAYIERLAAKSPEAKLALQAFMQRPPSRKDQV
jgi:hypothetical protein